MSCIMLMSTILHVYWYISANGVNSEGTVNVSIQTSTRVFGKPFELSCTFTGSSCCTLARIWKSDGDTIMTNGVPKSRRYQEVVNGSAKYFSLIITRLEESDFGKTYCCQYDFVTSTRYLLTHDNTYIYPPTTPTTGSCPMSNDKRSIWGTLNITKSQPSPTFLAYYGKNNWTSLLSTTPSVLYDTFYYTRSATLNLPDGLTCRDDETFNLIVVTGTVETQICSVDYCKCGECAGKYYGWSVLGTVGCTIFILILVLKVPSLAVFTTKEIIMGVVVSFLVSAAVNVLVAVSCGLKVCSCIDGTDPIFVILGVGTSATTAIIVGIVLRKKRGCKSDNGKTYELTSQGNVDSHQEENKK